MLITDDDVYGILVECSQAVGHELKLLQRLRGIVKSNTLGNM